MRCIEDEIFEPRLEKTTLRIARDVGLKVHVESITDLDMHNPSNSVCVGLKFQPSSSKQLSDCIHRPPLHHSHARSIASHSESF